MKWVITTMNVSTMSRLLRSVRSMSRLYVLLAAAVLLCLFVTGLAGLVQHKWSSSATSPMKGATSVLSSSFFLDMLAMELPQFRQNEPTSTFSPRNTFSFLLHAVTNVHPGDPRSFLASEMTGMKNDSSVLLYPGQATQSTDRPTDFTPPPDAIQPDPQAGGTPGTPPPAEPEPAPAEPDNTETASHEPGIFIYHSHNRESFLPELKERGITSPDLAQDTDINITLVGKRLKEQIEKQGIPVLHATNDYPTEVEGFNYAKSYAYSAVTVKEAMAQHQKIGMIFDLHRDSLTRDRTTATIDGKDYAQVYFVVGKKNPNWEQNADFAKQLHTRLESEYPGISRGIFGKASNGNGEYNQSLSPNSMLVEIGGPYNSLEEMYRTADLLANVIAELYHNAKKVDAPALPPAQPQ